MSHALFSCVSSLLRFCLFSQLMILVSRSYDATEKQRKSFQFAMYLFLCCKKPKAQRKGWWYKSKSFCLYPLLPFQGWGRKGLCAPECQGVAKYIQLLYICPAYSTLGKEVVVPLQKTLNLPTLMDQREGTQQQGWGASIKEARGRIRTSLFEAGTRRGWLGWDDFPLSWGRRIFTWNLYITPGKWLW